MLQQIQGRSYPIMATIDETAKLFNVSRHFVRSKAKQGADWVVKSGRKYLINCDKFAEFLNGDNKKQTKP